MEKIKALLKNKVMYIGLFVGIVIALAYGRYLKPVKALADKLPKSDAKTPSA
jgi:hypothetical protein